MKAVSCIVWTSVWLLALMAISGLAGIDGLLTAAISIVTLVGMAGSLAIALRDDAPVADQPVERTTAEVVSSIGVHVHPSRLALPAPSDMARYEKKGSTWES